MPDSDLFVHANAYTDSNGYTLHVTASMFKGRRGLTRDYVFVGPSLGGYYDERFHSLNFNGCICGRGCMCVIVKLKFCIRTYTCFCPKLYYRVDVCAMYMRCP